MSAFDLENKIAIITGGASGIGYQTAKILLKDKVTCILWDKNNEKGKQALSELQAMGNVSFCSVDITSEKSVLKALNICKSEYGSPNILINSAGILGKKGNLWECNIDDWKSVVENNLYGYFLVCHSVIPLMLNTDYGRIVNVSSVSGKDGSIYASHYSASKAGIIALTKSLAKELATENILVNCVTPSATNTPLHIAEPEHDRLRQIDKIPLNRIGEPIEVARLIEWLCSPLCSFSTGAIFDISGGRSTY
jgi:2-dehydro-3-deoxy-L-rhamnonate dehydrogenase (NAD+)